MNRIPYQGSKQSIIKKMFVIINNDLQNHNCLFTQNNKITKIYDLFCGGGAVGYYFHTKGFQVVMNDIQQPLIDLHTKLQEGIDKELLYKWISREEFAELKERQDWYGELIRRCWSFGNGGKGYMFGKDIEELKKMLYDIVVFQDIQVLNSFNKQYNINFQMPNGNTAEQRLKNWKITICAFRKDKYGIKDIRAIFPIIKGIKIYNNNLDELLQSDYLKSRLLKKQNKKCIEYFNQLQKIIKQDNIALFDLLKNLQLLESFTLVLPLTSLLRIEKLMKL